MRAIRTGLSYTSRSCTSVFTALVFVLTLCVSGMDARAQVPAAAPASAFQNVVMSQALEIGPLNGSDGTQSGQAPSGANIAVNSNGDAILGDTYGGNVLLYSHTNIGVANPPKPTVLGSPGGNPSGMAVDSKNNLYIALTTVSTIIKLPYVNGAYVALAATTGTTPNCTGNDTVECIMSNLNTKGSGVASLVFDSKGDIFYTTTNIADNGAGTAPNSVWECTAACLYTGTPAATILYTEPTSSSPGTTGQLNVGAIAVDSFGDVFFTDTAQNPTTANLSYTSNLNELVYTSGTGFAKTPTVIYNYTPGTAAAYDNQIDGVAVDASNTVYALVTGSPGLVAFPNNNGAISTNKMYVASTTTGKVLGTDGQGDFYVAAYNNTAGADLVYWVGVDVLRATPTAVAAPSTASFTTILNDGGCSPAPSVTFAATGTNASAFSAATSGSCSSTATGGSFASTLTFTPAVVGTSVATLTATDSSSNTGAPAVTGQGTGTVASPSFSPAAGTYTAAQTVTISDATVGASIYYTTDGSTPAPNTGTTTLYSAPISVAVSETVKAIAVDSGDTSSTVSSAAYQINLPGAAATPTFSPAAGSFTAPVAVTISDTTAGATIYYTLDGSTPTTSSQVYAYPIVVSSTETIKAIATAAGASTSAVGSALYTLTLPASAFQNVVMTQLTKYGAFPSGGGGESGAVPAGDTMAVNSNGNVIASDTYGGHTVMFSPSGTVTVLGTTSNTTGVAVDNHNNLFQGFSYSNKVVKVPYVNGTYAALTTPSGSTPNCTGNDTTECVMNYLTGGGGASIVSMVFDSKGDLFYATGNSAGNPGGYTTYVNNAIFECTAACLYTGAPAPTLVFAEPVSTTPTTTGQLSIGGLAFDTSSDLFFTDSAISSSTSQESFSSDLDELVYTSGTGYSTTPTVIYTYTPSSVGQYGPEINDVAVAPNGTVYALLQSTTGILAFPKVSGSYSSKNMYLVASQTGKLMTGDAYGNLYIQDSSSNLDQLAVDTLTAPTTPVQNPVTATNITTYLNDGGCTSTPPTVTFAFTGTSASAFSAKTTGSCTGTSLGASFATSLTFTPTATGLSTATMTATDSLKNTGVAQVSGTGTPAPPAATPTFSVAPGTYTTIQTVTISSTTPSASIYYTLDGSTPTTSSTLYTGPIAVATTETINAIATAYGYTPSPVGTAAYVINLPTATTPAFSVAAGTYTTIQTVSITDATAGAAIYYTLDGSTPTASSTRYTTPITVSATETINAIAIVYNYNNSAVASATYTINLPYVATPTFSVAAGTYTTVQSVSISDATSGAKIYYTLNGTTPTTGSTLYTGPIMIPGSAATSVTINAIAVDPPNYNNSVVASATYVINLPAPGFTITASNTTVDIPKVGTGNVTLTITANAAFNGTIGFSCSGFLPVGGTCLFNPNSVSLQALGTTNVILAVSVPETAELHRGPNPLLPGTMLAAVLGLVGLRKRRRLQVLLLFVFSAVGMNLFTGCTVTKNTIPTSSQIVVTGSGSSCPAYNLACTTNPPPQPVPASSTLPLVVTVEP